MSANDTVTTADSTLSMTTIATSSAILTAPTASTNPPSASISTPIVSTPTSTSIDTPSTSTPSMSSSTAQPPTTTAQPPSTTTQPPSTTQPPPTTQSPSTTQPPPTTTQPPSTTEPPSTTQPPPTTEPPSTTQPPTTTPESSTTHPPPTSSVQPPPSPLSISETPDPTPIPTTTISSTVFITTTDNRGLPTSTAPRILTLTSISTNKHGVIVTVTDVVANPTLAAKVPSSTGPAFFHNRGAVAAVFLLVGLATVAIFLWIFFAARRRRRTLRIEQDSAISASLAAAGFHRTPLYEDDDLGTTSHSRSGSQGAFPLQRRSSSGPSAGRPSITYLDTTPLQPHGDNDAHDYNPYFNTAEGHVSAPPPPSAFIAGPYRDRSSTGTNGDLSGHSRQQSSSGSGSYEPLLASYYQRSIGTTPPPAANTTLQRNTSQHYSEFGLLPPGYRSSVGYPNSAPHPPTASSASSVYSTQTTGDDRLDPDLRRRLQDDTDTSRDLRDEEDYSRPVLGIRNLPDSSSQVSAP